MLQAPRTAVLMQTPAESNEAASIRRVAVLTFEGYQGREFAAEIQGVLAGAKIHDAAYFSVADRSMNERIFAEIKLSQSGAISKEQALRLGRMLGVKGLYAGNVGNVTNSQSHYQESRSRCNDTNAKLFSLCKNPVNTTVSCTRNVVTFAFSPKLIDAETGQIVYGRNISESVATQSCSDDTTPSPSNAQMAEQAKKLALKSFLKDVAPSFQEVQVQLLDSSAGLDAQAQAKLSQGVAFAVAMRLDRACELWEEANQRANRSPALHYNLGVCAEAGGRIERALELYTQADRMLEQPNDQISWALARVKQTKRNAGKFASQVK
jgi:tetratricopeptide (TPR) repeat protein